MSRPERAVFRLPGISLVIPFLLFVCVTPLANAGADFLLALYVFPVVGLAYILLTRTVADTDHIRATGLLGGKRVAWADLDGLEFHGPRWAIAVAADGRRFRLPMVRPRDLPRLAQVSGGRLLLGRDAPAEPVEDADSLQDVSPEVEQVEVDTAGGQHPGPQTGAGRPAVGQPAAGTPVDDQADEQPATDQGDEPVLVVEYSDHRRTDG